MDEYAGRVLADRYRLPVPAADAYEFAESRAFDTYSGQEVLVRQVPLPEVVEAEVLDADGLPEGFRPGGPAARGAAEPAVARAIEAAQAAAQIPDHPRLDQVFDVFAEGGSLWVVSEVVAARPLAAVLAEAPLSPYRAAEVASDVLTALRALHAHGWVHRNITARTVLVCDDGRVVLTGMAAGAAEEALCGYDPRPAASSVGGEVDPASSPEALPEPFSASASASASEVEADPGDFRAARAGAIAAYRAGARAAAGGEAWHGAGPRAGREVEAGPEGGVRPARWNELVAGADADADADADAGAGAGVEDTGLRPGPRSSIAGGAGFLPDRAEFSPDRAGFLPDRAGFVPDRAEFSPDRGGFVPDRGGSPLTGVAAERARQVRMTVVGPVTERWAPEQAYPVQESWQLAAPVGPATDLWALGALLFRAVQGHAPYPEESTPELVQMVCAEPPAFAEECGPLRPVVESLLRQDPTERLDFEELGGWLRSLVRSAPEPEAGANVVPAPPFDAARLPIVRRRGELVRRHARHKRGRAPKAKKPQKPQNAQRAQKAPRPQKAQPLSRAANASTGVAAPEAMRTPRAPRAPRPQKAARPPGSLGRRLLVLVLVGLVGAVAYAVVFLPKDDTGSGTKENANSVGGAPERTPSASDGKGAGEPSAPGSSASPDGKSSSDPSSTQPQSDIAAGFTLRKDPEGFEVAVAKGWQRQAKNGRGQVLYTRGKFELLLVPGRDSTATYGSDPMKYQREDERELQSFRDSTWATSSGMKSINVGGRAMAEGQFTWEGSDGREVFVRNLAMVVGGKYHVVQVRGPEAERDEVTRLYDQASATYQYGG
ncbi:protein kinase [Streptomyces kunmingensis]|uniref:Protein kinase n=1 Tax=Streptomyces kunmingensis TaxID=68225 RepID=A0ABU6C7P8_9ACTN|nr:protein kinase [Streptomyces kunmingensis]MEB3959870.1 protein kinase [Streptomyces kunmingensis]